MLLIYCRHKILRPRGIQTFQRLKNQVLSFILGFDQEHRPPEFHRDLHLLRLIINIHQQHIVQNQILDKTVLIHLLLVSKQKILQLADSKPARHLHLRTSPFQHKDVTWVLVVMHKKHPQIFLYAEKKLLRRYRRRRFSKRRHSPVKPRHPLVRHDKANSLHIPYRTF